MSTVLRRLALLAVVGAVVAVPVLRGSSRAGDATSTAMQLPVSEAPAPADLASTERAPTASPSPDTAPKPAVAAAAYSHDYIATDAGCATDLSADGLESFFSARVGPVIGHDSPRVIPLGGQRFLWLLQDTFIDYTGRAATMSAGQYISSTALVQDGRCFTALQRGTTAAVLSFDPGTGESFNDFFWPAGGSVNGSTLSLFWIEIIRDPVPADPLDGSNVHPVKTWLATYDVQSLQRLSFVPAPNPGVAPIYGFAVADDGDYSYLFGNSFVENLSREGGYKNGPHSATKMWLARVPRGRLDAVPEYRTATAWSADPAAAVAISSRFFTENAMRPVVIDGHWYSVTKPDAFLGSTVVIDTADAPWGPWTTVVTMPALPRGNTVGMVTYSPILMPWLDPSGDLIVDLSQIDIGWEQHNGGDPTRYRPRLFTVPTHAPPSGSVGGLKQAQRKGDAQPIAG
ncbi:MAG: hypothetical protein JWL72_3091 [Ilumatobacteraceae bacterium]|nr:hypothetical protein [Ilumatobacteraceae bacterium]